MKEYTTYKDMAFAIANKQDINGNSVTAFMAVDSYIVISYNTPMLVINKNNIACINVKKNIAVLQQKYKISSAIIMALT